MRRLQLFFIVGTSFSGSTIISNSLAGGGVLSLGEVDRFVPFLRHDLNYQIERCTICGSVEAHEECPIFGKESREKIEKHQSLVDKYLELVSSTNAEIIIDASKSADWVKDLVDGGIRNHCDVYAIVSSRNPIAYAFSAADATKSPYWASVVAWRETYNHALRVLSHRAVPYLVIPYEDIFNPLTAERFVSGVKSLTGGRLGFSLGNFCGGEHALGGNLGVHINNKNFKSSNFLRMKEFTADESWKLDIYQTQVPKESTRWIEIGESTAYSLLQIPGIVDLMGLMGYSVNQLVGYFRTKPDR